MSDAVPDDPNRQLTQKQRHGCLTAYLVGADAIRRQIPNLPEWAFPVLIVGSILNLVFAIALFKWKKWGFFGFVGTSIVIFFVNISNGFALGPALMGLLGVAILYGVLHIGKQNKGWAQLE